jgi:hypothetical protein
MEYLEGVVEKLDEVPDEHQSAVESLFDRFYDAGIKTVGDASVIRPKTSGPIKGEQRWVRTGLLEVKVSGGS